MKRHRHALLGLAGSRYLTAVAPGIREPLITDRHMELLAWLLDHPAGTIAAAAAALGVSQADVEALRQDLIDAEMVEQHPRH